MPVVVYLFVSFSFIDEGETNAAHCRHQWQDQCCSLLSSRPMLLVVVLKTNAAHRRHQDQCCSSSSSRPMLLVILVDVKITVACRC
jgi:hypothetical protein